jgi:hypothetical protein
MDLEVAGECRRSAIAGIAGLLAIAVVGWGVIAAFALGAPVAAAADDAAPPQPGVGPSPYALDAGSPFAVEQPSRFSLRALLDLRVVRGSEAPSWQEGGPGKLRYGGVVGDGEFRRTARFAISQLALQPAVDLPLTVRAQAQLNWDGDLDQDGETSPDHDPVRITEAFLRRDWADSSGGTGLVVGLVNPPFSLEHVGPARTPLLTLTPSALSSWLWEEGRVLGVEGHWWHATRQDAEVAAFAGAGWGPDQQGILLARRGWVLSDFLTGANSSLPIPGATQRTRVFDERDGRPAIYFGASLSDPWKIVAAHAGYMDNLGDLAVDGVWETRFGVAGVVLQPAAGLDLTVQWLYGTTTTRGVDLASTVSAVYPIVSYRWRGMRLSFRFDDFRVRDDDGGPSTAESGQAYTVAWMLELGLRHRIAVEYVAVDADRVGVADPGDDGWQVSYRLRY